MKRFAEMVLDGHPDKFCDIVADAVLGDAVRRDPAALGQIEVSVFSDRLWVNGYIATALRGGPDIRAVVRRVGRAIGYVPGNYINVNRYRIECTVCLQRPVPESLAALPHDQCVAVGWAGYDEKTAFLPPEQFAARRLRDALVRACRVGGRLEREGPDGKLILCMNEVGGTFRLETVGVTLQHRPETSLSLLRTRVTTVLQRAYGALQRRDARWVVPWRAVRVTVNPNGPLVAAGSCGDNGQTGRKLAMDYYGPRVPVGGGALSGKSVRHVDRAAAYAARRAAIRAVLFGAGECRVTVAYVPGRAYPLGIECICAQPPRGPAAYPTREEFRFPDFCLSWEPLAVRIARTADGSHFTDPSLPWNRAGGTGGHTSAPKGGVLQ